MHTEKQNYKFMQNSDCEYFLCHPTEDREGFNCLFCFCPLYHLGEACGGDFRIIAGGIKDCSMCGFPHARANYDYIMERLGSE